MEHVGLVRSLFEHRLPSSSRARVDGTGRHVGRRAGPLLLVAEVSGDDFTDDALLVRDRREQPTHRMRGHLRHLRETTDAFHVLAHPIAPVRAAVLVREQVLGAVAILRARGQRLA